MKTYFECLPCFINQTLWITEELKIDPVKKEAILKKVCTELGSISLNTPPPLIAKKIYVVIEDITGIKDPFREQKIKSTQIAETFVPFLKEKIKNAPDTLLEAAKVSIIGNVIDFGALPSFDLKKEIEELDKKNFGVCDIDQFRKTLNAAGTILYIGDNAGETVFDRIFIETINKKVFYAVRSYPIINDATTEDARMAKLQAVSTVIESGSKTAGTVMKEATPEFMKLFEQADMVISKGQGNFETLSDVKRPVFFLLKVKCPVVAKHLQCKKGDFVLKLQGNR